MTAPTFTSGVTVVLSGLIALSVTYVLTPLVRLIAIRRDLVAHPRNDRWGHRLTARLGGVAIYGGFLIASVFCGSVDRQVVTLLVGCTAIFGIGLFDDLRRMRPYSKLLFQLAVGAQLVMGGIRIELISLSWVAIPVSIFWFVFVINAFNLLDNMDGLAAGVGAIASGFCLLHALSDGQWLVATLAAIVSGACLGFLRYNFPPAKIFMGDSGSHLLGLSLAALALLGSWQHSTQLLSILAVPVLVLAVPIFDACFVTIQRLAHHQHPFQGGTDHVSHRLAILGLSERQTVFSLYGLSAGLGLLSLVSMQLTTLSAVVLWLLTATGLTLLGVYLAKVKVYTLAPAVPEATTLPPSSARPTTFIETMLLHKRRLLEVFIDFGLICSAYVAAHVLRFEGTLNLELQRLIVQSLPLIIVVKLGCFASAGFYRGVWRYVSLPDLLTVFKGVTLSSILSALALLYLWRFEGYSRAVFIVDWMLTLLAVGGARIVERLLDTSISTAIARGIPVLILGAGDTGAHVLRSLEYGSQPLRRVIGFLDDDRRKHGNCIHRVSVLGDRSRLAELLDTHQVREVLVAISDPPGDLLQEVQHCCEPRGVTWKVVTAGVTDTV